MQQRPDQRENYAQKSQKFDVKVVVSSQTMTGTVRAQWESLRE